MIAATTFAGRNIALFGLGGSGLATAKALMAGGARVQAGDDGAEARARAVSEGIEVVDLAEADWSRFDALVLSPGVPLTHPKPHWTAARAAAVGIEIIGDIEIFTRERAAHAPEAPFVAITGTNGKSTTTALIAHILAHAGRDVAVGGNIGTAILSLPPPADERVHVVECSSYQIDLAPSLAPSLGILLNVTPDHLDRHGTIANYAAIKERLAAAADIAVIAVDDAFTAAAAERISRKGGRLVEVSAARSLSEGVFAEGERLVEAGHGRSDVVADLAGLGALRGRHNAQNAAAAFAACRALGLSAEEIAAGFRTFPGLPHRMEEVGRRGRVLFVNDSKATNAEAAAPALSSFHSIHWIAGGRSKEGGIGALAPLFSRIAKAYLIGEAAEGFAAALDGAVPHVLAGDLETALKTAAADAHESAASEPVVLLSPACASFDQFRSFEHRGDVFRALVRDLVSGTPHA